MFASHAERLWICALVGAAGTAAAAAQDITAPGDTVVPSSNNFPAAEAPPNAIDNNAGSKYLNFDKLNTGFTVTPSGSGIVRGLTLITANDAPQRDPASYTLEGSNDGVNFTMISSGPLNLSTNRYALSQVGFANSAAYSQYRVLFPTIRNAATANSMQVAEVQLNTAINILSPGDGISAVYSAGASSPAGQGAAALVDGQLGVKFNVVGGNLGPTAVNIIPAAGATVVTGIDVFSGPDDAAFPGRTPATFTLEGSNDGSTFTPIFTTALTAMNNNYLDQQYSFANTQSFTRYRVTLGTSSDTSMQLGEIQLFGTVGATPPANDNCANAQTIVAGANPGTSVNATGSTTSPCGTGDSADVWFRYVATTTGTVEANTCQAGALDTTLAVYPSCGGAAITCDDNSCGAKSRVRWNATAGTAYLIRVAGTSGATGGFTLTIDNAPVVHNDVRVTLGYNFNGMVHQGEANDPDNPNGFRSLSDRAFRQTGTPGSIEVGLEGRTGIPYQVVTQAGALDLVQLGNRNICDNGNHQFDAAPNGDDLGIQPNWLPNPDQTGPQTTSVSSLNLRMGATTRLGVIYNASNGGTYFDMTLNFTSGASATVQLHAPDWFGDMQPFPAGAGVEAQAELGLFFGTSNEDAGLPDVDLNAAEAIVGTQSLLDAGLGDVTGLQLSSIVFSNPISTLADIGIYALTVRDPVGTASGACCNGSTCSVTSAAACAGSHTRYSGDGTVCNAAGNTRTPCCKGDYNQTHGAVEPTVQDIFDFLSAYFSGDPSADINSSGGVPTVQDIFDFLSAYFSGC